MSVVVISGVPGAAKTLFAVSLIRNFIRDSPDRQIYTDIDDICIAGVNSTIPENDWRLTPQGSIIIYDEAQKLFPALGKEGIGRIPDILVDLETHRHKGYDIYFITQHPIMLNIHIRRMASEHYYLTRAFNGNRSIVHYWPRCVNTDDRRELRNADRSTFKHDKSLFSYYHSSSNHNYKFKMPKKLLFLFIAIALIIVFLLFNLYRSHWHLLSTPDHHSARRAVPAPRTVVHSFVADSVYSNVISNHPVAKSIAGCIAYQSKCACFNSLGHPLIISVSLCYKYINQPIPFTIIGMHR